LRILEWVSCKTNPIQLISDKVANKLKMGKRKPVILAQAIKVLILGKVDMKFKLRDMVWA